VNRFRSVLLSPPLLPSGKSRRRKGTGRSPPPSFPLRKKKAARTFPSLLFLSGFRLVTVLTFLCAVKSSRIWTFSFPFFFGGGKQRVRATTSPPSFSLPRGQPPLCNRRGLERITPFLLSFLFFLRVFPLSPLFVRAGRGRRFSLEEWFPPFPPPPAHSTTMGKSEHLFFFSFHKRRDLPFPSSSLSPFEGGKWSAFSYPFLPPEKASIPFVLLFMCRRTRSCSWERGMARSLPLPSLSPFFSFLPARIIERMSDEPSLFFSFFLFQ